MMEASLFIFLFLICLFSQSIAVDKKILICGIAQNLDNIIEHSMRNMELLGQEFTAHKIIVYENNSSDLTPFILENWADVNPQVRFISENIPISQMSSARTERMAEARNRLLSVVKEYSDFDFVVMADLDFTCDWPIQEIIATIESPFEWDCVTANGIDEQGFYVDKYALRSEDYPLGPELLGFDWWKICKDLRFRVAGEGWQPIYSGFGGLAIYKMASLQNSWYAGNTTKELKDFYRGIFEKIDKDHLHWKMYLERLHHDGKGMIPVMFTYNTSWEHAENHLLVTCCEHVGLHADMHKRGFTKFYINPAMIMKY